MKLLIAGSRSLFPSIAQIDQALLELMAEQCAIIRPTQVISGGALGTDLAGEAWAEARGIKVVFFRAEWEQHGRSAGVRRNAAMARACDVALVWWDGVSRGTKHMIERLDREGKPYLVTRTSS